jgi:hypothetical protein
MLAVRIRALRWLILANVFSVLWGYVRPAQAYSISSSHQKVVTAEGAADIQAGATATAREAAIRVAQRAALESVAGVHLRSFLEQEAFSQVQGGTEKFTQTVTAKLIARSDGFIRDFQILHESQEGAVYKVLLEVTIDDMGISRETALIARGLASARFPKIVLAVTEEYTDSAGKSLQVPEPALLALLEDALLARGFDLVAKGRLERMRKEEEKAFAKLFGPENVAAKLAMSYGAEYLVNAAARTKYTSRNDLGMNELHGYTELTLRAVNASSAAVVASFKQSGNSPAGVYSEEDLRIRSVQHVAPLMVENLVTRILESWDRDEHNGVRYSVKLLGVKSYKTQVAPFLELLSHLPNVKQVKEISFGENRLEVEVFYPSSEDVSVLKRAIIEAAGQARQFKGMDVAYSRGRELNFRL